MYTFMLVKHLPLHGFLCRTCCSTTLRGFIWFSTILLSCLFPLFPPKKKSEAEKIATVCEELERFVLEHGRPPSQHSEIEGSRSLYKRLQKLKLTHKLQHDWREDVCQAVQRFYDDNAQRLPKRQNVLDDERRNEDLLARRWERLMGQKDSVSFELQQRYSGLFAAVDVATEGGRVATCVAVQEFFNNRGGVLPKRQNACRSEEQRSEDALARRWDRVVEKRTELSDDVLNRFEALFVATENEPEDTPMQVCEAVAAFRQRTGFLPKRQNACRSEEQRSEDALARRWDRVVEKRTELSDDVLNRFEALFVAMENEKEDTSMQVCQAVAAFLEKTGFLPKRQNACRSEEQRSEDALARRWDRLVEKRRELSDDVLNRFEALFVATENEPEDMPMQVCQAVAEFLEKYGSLPRRHFMAVLPEKQAEDSLAQRLNRVLSHKVELSRDLLEEFAVVFKACAGRWIEAEKGGLANFLETTSVCEVFAMCSNLNEDSVQRFVGSNSNDFKAACVAWLLEKFEQGHEELSGLAVDGLDEFDDTKAVREELKEYVFKSGSLPPVAAGNRSADESRLQKALVQVRKRRVQRVRSTRKGRLIDVASALSEAQMVAWETVEEFGPFLWNPRHAETFEAVQQCVAETGELPVRGPRSSTDALAQKVRRLRLLTYAPGRQRMRQMEQWHWDTNFPKIWSQRQSKDYYLASEHVQDGDSRRVFHRTPLEKGLLACELCDFDCDNRMDFLIHLRDAHFPKNSAGVDHELSRCEEEYRKRMVFHEQESGPFPVPGEQTRRGVASYAFHQTHSRKGSEARERQLQSCMICARTCWLEDMERLQMFVEAGKDSEDVVDDAASEVSEEEAKQDKKKVGWKIYELDKKKVNWVHERIFDVYRYHKLWPRIPLEELKASCVEHPTGTYAADGTPWLWLVNKKVLPEHVTSTTTSFCCKSCVQAITAKKPRMPKFALANSLWIGRYPKVFMHDGKPLSPMTFLLLSLGRPVVQKIIAEPHKARPVKEKQKGIRANTIAFPQAQLHELATAHLPPLPQEAQRFLSQTISIALVGCTPEAWMIPNHFYLFISRKV